MRYSYGKSLKIVLVRSLQNSPPREQLMAALLRGDRHSALDLFQRPDVANDFLRKEVSAGETALIYGRLCEMQLSDGAPDEMIQSLKEEAKSAAIGCGRMNVIRRQLMIALDGIPVVWIKGPAMVAALYDDLVERSYSDFDLVVRYEDVERIVERLAREGYAIDLIDPGSCHQIGTGPCGSIPDLLLQPSAEFERCHNITLKKHGAPNVELKFSPLDTGLQMRELDRFFNESVEIEGMKIPWHVDHLLLQLTHLHKHGFIGWKWIYDVHLLAQKISTIDGAWHQVVRRAEIEGIIESVWAGLTIVKDRLDSPIPDQVISSLVPKRNQFMLSYLTFTVSPEFMWNSLGLPMLLLSASALGDMQRKLAAIRDCLMPSAYFLRQYYVGGRQVSQLELTWLNLVNLMVLVCPAALVRNTFGKRIWPTNLPAPNRTS